MGEEGAADHQPQPVALAERVPRHEVLEAELVDTAGPQQLAARPATAIAGTEDVQPRAHQVEGRSVGRYVEELDPDVDVAGVGGRDVHMRRDRSHDPQLVFAELPPLMSLDGIDKPTRAWQTPDDRGREETLLAHSRREGGFG